MQIRNRLALSVVAVAAAGAAPVFGQTRCVTIFDRFHCPGIETTLDTSGGVLTVSATDDTPEVEADCPGELRYVAIFDPIVFPSDINTAARFRAVGMIDGMHTQTVASIRPSYDVDDGKFSVFGSLSGVAVYIRLDVYDDGILTGSEPVLDSRITATTKSIPEVVRMGLRTDGEIRAIIKFTADADWTAGALQATGDELHFVQTLASGTLSELEFVCLETIFIHSFTIKAEIGSNPEITIEGACPGAATVTVTDATPNGTVAIIGALGKGSVVIPLGVCAGTALGLNGTATLAFTIPVDGSGVAAAQVNLPALVCGRAFAQAIDLGSCATSNVAGL